MNELSSGILISPDHWAQMEAHVSSKVPEEACGLVAGKGNQAESVFPITNILHEKFRFRMEPEEQLKAFLQIEQKGWEVLAIYHSHPQGIAHPSATDYQELTFPGIIYLIWYRESNQWYCRGYLMNSTTEASEIQVTISTNQ